MKAMIGRWMVALAGMMVAGALTVSGLPTSAATPQQQASAVKVQKAQRTPKAQKAQRKPKAAKTIEGKINLNSASAEELDALPRIGPKVAQRMVEYRTAHNGFKTVDELRNVKGIGPKLLEAIRPYLTL
ncbi:MAG: helix-hairpin-helix domain-containing protein [Acidobacteriota bacterium]